MIKYLVTDVPRNSTTLPTGGFSETKDRVESDGNTVLPEVNPSLALIRAVLWFNNLDEVSALGCNANGWVLAGITCRFLNMGAITTSSVFLGRSGCSFMALFILLPDFNRPEMFGTVSSTLALGATLICVDCFLYLKSLWQRHLLYANVEWIESLLIPFPTIMFSHFLQSCICTSPPPLLSGLLSSLVNTTLLAMIGLCCREGLNSWHPKNSSLWAWIGSAQRSYKQRSRLLSTVVRPHSIFIVMFPRPRPRASR